MKKLIGGLLAFALCSSGMGGACTKAFAYNYDFGSGPSANDVFGKPTGYDEPAVVGGTATNERRNKDAAFLPPPYFYGSGDIPTDPSSPYHDNAAAGSGSGYGGGSGTSGGGYGGGGGTSGLTSANGAGSASNGGGANVAAYYPGADGLMASTSVAAANTAVLYYDDGSIGTLTIQKLNKVIKVYEGESLENMRKGIGHFDFTSAWDGLVGLAGHNRGAAAYFAFVKDMQIGDRIVYATKYGARTYSVTSRVKISETDYSGLAWSADNVICLITCVENESAYRWLVTAKEILP